MPCFSMPVSRRLLLVAIFLLIAAVHGTNLPLEGAPPGAGLVDDNGENCLLELDDARAGSDGLEQEATMDAGGKDPSHVCTIRQQSHPPSIPGADGAERTTLRAQLWHRCIDRA